MLMTVHGHVCLIAYDRALVVPLGSCTDRAWSLVCFELHVRMPASHWFTAHETRQLLDVEQLSYTQRDYSLRSTQDFPLDLLQQAVSMLLVDDGLECRLPLADFTRAFRIQLVFNEWLDECRASCIPPTPSPPCVRCAAGSAAASSRALEYTHKLSCV